MGTNLCNMHRNMSGDVGRTYPTNLVAVTWFCICVFETNHSIHISINLSSNVMVASIRQASVIVRYVAYCTRLHLA